MSFANWSFRSQKAIEAVLAELSNMAAAENENIADNFRVLTQLDFIFARAMLSKSYNGTEPIFNEKGHINIKKAAIPCWTRKAWFPSISGSERISAFWSSPDRTPEVRPFP